MRISHMHVRTCPDVVWGVQQECGEQRGMWCSVMEWLRNGSSTQGSNTPPANKENHKKNEETKGFGGGAVIHRDQSRERVMWEKKSERR